MSWNLNNGNIWKNELLKNMIKKYSYQDNFLDMITFSNLIEREVFIDSISPKVASDINSIIRFWNSVDEESAIALSEREPIKIYINSYGGSLAAALTLIDSIKLSKTPIETINIGSAYKEAFFVFLSGHRRYAYPRSSFLLEKNLKQFDITEEENSSYVTFCERQVTELKDMVLEKTKISETEYNQKKEGWWLTAEKAYELKICNEVLRTKF